MKTKILILIFGVVSGMFIGVQGGYYLNGPRDISASFSPELKKKWHSPDLAFIKNSRLLSVGPFVVLLPEEQGQKLLAHISIEEPPNFPTIDIHDNDGNGIPNGLMMTDSAGNMFNLYDNNEDGIWDSQSYSTKVRTKDSCSFVDYNMDGIFDVKFTPNKNNDTFIELDPKWYKLHSEDNKNYILINGKREAVKLYNGVWKTE